MEFICLLYLSRGTGQEDHSPCAKLQATVALQNDQQGFVHSTCGQSGFVKVALCTGLWVQGRSKTIRKAKLRRKEAPSTISVQQTRFGKGLPQSTLLHGALSAGAKSCCSVPAGMGKRRVYIVLVNQ